MCDLWLKSWLIKFCVLNFDNKYKFNVKLNWKCEICCSKVDWFDFLLLNIQNNDCKSQSYSVARSLTKQSLIEKVLLRLRLKNLNQKIKIHFSRSNCSLKWLFFKKRNLNLKNIYFSMQQFWGFQILPS
jgi:hypothetical protein